MRYRRARTEGGTYFFTLVTYDRRRFLCEPEAIALLKAAFRYVMVQYPFKIEAIVMLPDHLHCIWALPEGDSNFSTRWRLVKAYFTRKCDVAYRGRESASRKQKGEQTVWQRRFWEHQIRDEQDFARHVEYIHYNPVKHGLVKAPREWPHSSFRRYVQAGIYDEVWGDGDEIVFPASIGAGVMQRCWVSASPQPNLQIGD